MPSAFSRAFAPNTSDRDELDFYPTVPGPTLALINNQEFHGPIWEPACGAGDMSEVLKLTGCPVISTDVFDYGYGDVQDFLTVDPNKVEGITHIVTNPPYRHARAFIEKSLEIIPPEGSACFLLRLMYLEGVRRKTLLEQHLAEVMVSSGRIPFQKGRLPTKDDTGGKMVPFAWFIFKKDKVEATRLSWF